ncbi:Rgg/GadR/MutR family transcriptional regulator [Schleiferilactobacillus perolens]|jgi:Rgg/GadR/MutR family transcriptional activator|uniref:Rgg/GadR/MutR family transcriptional regulator n=1 Tax=Schleiferilactobacillus perolens TaxID=100468 RepID=UPI0023577510|nr:Rgg/GadR/MutR family transcriptional regulator [Schleiferilactobacillus perolens]MCI2172183.1 hypothetical protein [Schleiferilactobacillus perolens]
MVPDYGSFVHSIRTNNRRLSLAQTAYGIIDKSTLRKFEQGQTSLSFANIIPLLERLHIAPSELLYSKDNYQLSESASFFYSLAEAYNRRDLIQLQNLLNEQQAPHPNEPPKLPFRRLNAIAIKAAMGMLQNKPISPEDVGFATDYLVSQSAWFHYDLSILTYLPSFLSGDTLVWIVHNLYDHVAPLSDILNNASLITEIALNVATVLIAGKHNYEAANWLLTRSRREKSVQDRITSELRVKQLDAAIDYHRGNTKSAEDTYARILSTLHWLGLEQKASEIENLWPQLISSDH